jgi:hypothetical protein
MSLDNWPCCNHLEPAVLQAMFSTLHLQNRCQNGSLTMANEGSGSGSFTDGAGVAEAALVPWEYDASRVQCNDWWRCGVALEPVGQSHTNILQRSVQKIYLIMMEGNLAGLIRSLGGALCPQK